MHGRKNIKLHNICCFEERFCLQPSTL